MFEFVLITMLLALIGVAIFCGCLFMLAFTLQTVFNILGIDPLKKYKVA